MKHELKGIRRLMSALSNSRDGFVAAWKSEEAVRLELILALFVVVAIALVPAARLEKIILWLATFFVLFAEVVNTAIEYTVDRMGSEWNALSKTAKDLGSLLVLLSLVNFVLVWVWVLV